MELPRQTHSQYSAMTGSNEAPPVRASSCGMAMEAEAFGATPALEIVRDSHVTTWTAEVSDDQDG
jgi:hypothetical protein